MLAENVGVHVLLGNGQVLGDAGTQAGGIQQGAGTDDALLRDAGDLAENVSQDIHGVGHDDVGGIGADRGDLGHDALEDVDVGIDQIDTGLAGLAAHAGGDDNDIAALSGIIVAGVYVYRLAEQRRALMDVHGLAHRLIFVDIDDHDFVGDVLERKCKSGCRTYGTGADHCDLSVGHDSYLPSSSYIGMFL